MLTQSFFYYHAHEPQPALFSPIRLFFWSVYCLPGNNSRQMKCFSRVQKAKRNTKYIYIAYYFHINNNNNTHKKTILNKPGRWTMFKTTLFASQIPPRLVGGSVYKLPQSIKKFKRKGWRNEKSHGIFGAADFRSCPILCWVAWDYHDLRPSNVEGYSFHR